MPRDPNHVGALRPSPFPDAPETAAPETAAPSEAAPKPAEPRGGTARGLWRTASRRQRLVAGAAVLALTGGAAWAATRMPLEAWADVVAEPGSAARVPTAVAAPPRAAPRGAGPVNVQAPPGVAPAARLPAPAPTVIRPIPAAAAAAEDAPTEPVAPPPAAARDEAPAPAEDAGLAEARRLNAEAAQAAARRAAAASAAPQAPAIDARRFAAMVTEIARTQKETLERQIAADRAAQAFAENVTRRLAEMDQRLTFAEARAAVSATAGVAAGQGAVAPQPLARAAAAVRQAPPGPRAPVVGPQSYVLTAASPGMAVLRVANPMPGQSPTLEVRVGDDVPGLGRISRIGQRGTVWEVQTAGGTIER